MSGERPQLAVIAVTRIFAIGLALWSVATSAAEHSGAPLGLEHGPVEFPSLWRVAFGFLLCVALMVALIMLVRRFGDRWRIGSRSNAQIRVIEHASPAAGLRVTVIEVEDQRFLVADNRHALQVVALQSRATVTPAGAAAAASAVVSSSQQ